LGEDVKTWQEKLYWLIGKVLTFLQVIKMGRVLLNKMKATRFVSSNIKMDKCENM
jgi:hypothetical protein